MSNITNQKSKRQLIIARLDQLILNWNPRFVVSDETKVLSEEMLCDLKIARETLNMMFLPREDARVMIYYEVIANQLIKLEDTGIMSSYSGDVLLQPAIEKLLDAVNGWEALR